MRAFLQFIIKLYILISPGEWRPLLTYINICPQESGNPRYAWDEKALELLAAVGKMNSSRRRGKAAQAHEEQERLEEAERQAAGASEYLFSINLFLCFLVEISGLLVLSC